MQISDLPEEILVYIISNKLDVKSVYNLYKTCSFFKNIILKYNAVKTANLALSTVATMRFLMKDFMKDVSRYLHNLDLRCVADINKTSLLVAVRRMKNLKTLDVSYTNITLYDLFEVYKMCPTIKNLACNFVFGEKIDINASVPECENLFQNLEKLHLVGNVGNMLYSNVLKQVLRKAHLSQLQLSIVEKDYTVYGNVKESKSNTFPIFKFVSICIVNDRKISNIIPATIFTMPKFLEKEKYECVAIISYINSKNQIYVSPIFKKFFQHYNPMDVKDINFSKHIVNAVFMFWDKETNVFDDILFNEVKTKIDHFFPYNIRDDSTVAPKNIDTFFFRIPLQSIKSNNSTNILDLNKKRFAPEPQIVNLDTVLNNHIVAHLTLFFPDDNRYPVTLSPNSLYLRNLRSLSLTGIVQCSRTFFNILFRCCEQLQTLNVEDSPHMSNLSVIARNVPLSRSLKNLRLVNRNIDFGILLSYLSQCSTLENIHIIDNSQDCNDFADASTLLEKCTNLYYIYIHAVLSPCGKNRANRFIQKLGNEDCKCYKHVKFDTSLTNFKYTYDPFVDVFKVSELRPIEKLY